MYTISTPNRDSHADTHGIPDIYSYTKRNAFDYAFTNKHITANRHVNGNRYTIPPNDHPNTDAFGVAAQDCEPWQR
jgi:hypothetical protein